MFFDPIDNAANGGFCNTFSQSMTNEQVKLLSGLTKFNNDQCKDNYKLAMIGNVKKLNPGIDVDELIVKQKFIIENSDLVINDKIYKFLTKRNFGHYFFNFKENNINSLRSLKELSIEDIKALNISNDEDVKDLFDHMQKLKIKGSKIN
eukprot:TRINITY_DN1349_c1_g4_i1.p1 TRINITY_DN1349_c1_g4~~TRINITY_DN1349_c1_g4_i1.p1  ORF type:complete len:149 (+),score=36.49 TRINITY_DN1349_c1_g4_i1:42-488(+)